MKKLAVAVALLSIVGAAVAASAATIPPPNVPLAPGLGPVRTGPVGTVQAGEGAAVNTACGLPGGSCGIQHMDWVVQRTGPKTWTYWYQVENTSVAHLDLVTVESILYTAILGDAVGLDLDTTDVGGGGPFPAPGTAHTFPPNYPNIAGEAEAAGLVCCAPTVPSASAVPGLTNASWDTVVDCIPGKGPGCGGFGGLSESGLMILVGGPPVYVHWRTIDGASWDTGSLSCFVAGITCIKVPAPGEVAEPGSLFLLGVGVVGVGLAVRRKLRRK